MNGATDGAVVGEVRVPLLVGSGMPPLVDAPVAPIAPTALLLLVTGAPGTVP